MAKMLPEAKIIVTGGVPRNDKSEGIEMKQWLIAQGIDENRIIAENYATDTVENFIYSRYIIKQAKRNDIVIVSSATHVRRCHVILQSSPWPKENTITSQPSRPQTPPKKR